VSTLELRSFVGGRWQAGPGRLLDRNPARPDDVVAETRAADEALTAEAVEAAANASTSWRTKPAPARGELLRRAADILEGRAESVGRDLAREEGKTLPEAVAETRRAVAILRYYAGQTLEPDGDTYPSHSASTLLYARREPLGVVVAITPWNFPIAIPAWKIAPALAYGNTVVWKPAELVPLTSVHLVEALAEAGVPAGVVNLVLGRSADVGAVLVEHDAVAAITFTGSNAVGRRIQLAATERGKKVQLELGGKNPAVVLADADLAHAAEQVARGAFLSAGQKCTATSRVIVERPAFDELSERLAALARSWTVGDPLDPGTVVGPLASKAQLERVCGYLDGARAEGARFLAGGDRLDEAGYFLGPAVVADVDSRSRVAREEIFGPVAALLPVEDFGEAVTLTNDTPFGLTASLFTRDLGRALRFVGEARAGVVKVNQETAGLEFQAPFGGMKESSSGSREQGKVAREFFSEWKTVYLDPPPA
jgi:aldehyde dehydrogenase (NAD+)